MPAIAESRFQLKWYWSTGRCPRGGELWLAARPCRLPPGGAAGDLQLTRPPIPRLAMDTDLPSDRRFAQPLLEKRCRLESPCFERIEIPPHPHRIPHAARIAQPDGLVTILYGTQ